MDNGFSVLMLIFGIAILLYSAVLSSGNYKLLPVRVQPTLRKEDKKGQTKHIAAVSALTALPIALGGLAGCFWGNTVCLIAMLVSAAAIITIAIVRRRDKAETEQDTERSDSKENE